MLLKVNRSKFVPTETYRFYLSHQNNKNTTSAILPVPNNYYYFPDPSGFRITIGFQKLTFRSPNEEII